MSSEQRVADCVEREVDLYELFLIIKRKWKLILSIFLVSVLLTGIISFLSPPLYRIKVTIVPGWLDKTAEGRVILVDSVENIISAIENGSYNMNIIKALRIQDDLSLDDLEFEVERSEDSDVIHISNDAFDSSLGRNISEELLAQIKVFYNDRVELRKEKIDKLIHLLRNKILAIKNKVINVENEKDQIKNDKSKVENEKKRIKKEIELLKEKIAVLKETGAALTSQLLYVKENTKVMGEEKKALLKESGQKNAMALLLYSNTIQQNISYIDRLSSQIGQNKLELQRALTDIDKFELKLMDKDTDLKNLDLKLDKLDIKTKDVEAEINNSEQLIKSRELDKQLIEGVRVLQQPTVDPTPVKPKIKRNILIAALASLFFGVILSLFIEWFDEKKQASHEGKR